jgi:hypothetical protein
MNHHQLPPWQWWSPAAATISVVVVNNTPKSMNKREGLNNTHLIPPYYSKSRAPMTVKIISGDGGRNSGEVPLFRRLLSCGFNSLPVHICVSLSRAFYVRKTRTEAAVMVGFCGVPAQEMEKKKEVKRNSKGSYLCEVFPAVYAQFRRHSIPAASLHEF